MKKLIILIIAMMVTIVGFLSGCEEEGETEDNFIYVTVSAKTQLLKVKTGEITKGIEGMEIRMEIVKAGAVKKTQIFTTGSDGLTGNIYHTVKLYKEQRVRAKSYLTSVLPQNLLDEGFSVETYRYEELTWESVKATTDWGGTYYWSPTIQLIAST